MSLAQYADQPTSTRAEGAAHLVNGAPTRVSAIDFRQLARRSVTAPAATAPAVLDLVAPVTPVDRLVEKVATAAPAMVDAVPAAVHAPIPTAAAMAASAMPGPDHATGNPVLALELLGEVSTALSVLMSRCRQLENALETTRERARIDLEAAAEALRGSLETSERLSEDLAATQAANAELRARAEAMEERASATLALADQSQHAAAEAECLTALFQERVISAFGVGSAGHAILESIRGRTAPLAA